MKKELGIGLLLLLLCVGVALKNPTFYSAENVENLLNRIGMYTIFSIGTGIVIISGGIDLTPGSVFALEGVFLGMLLNERQWPWGGVVAVILGGALVLGIVHGFLIAKLRMQPFIVTLCGLLIYRSLARVVTDDSSKGLGDETAYGFLSAVATKDIPIWHGYNLPSSFIVLLVVAAIMYVVVHRSIYGRYLFAVGRNEEAARFSGIRTKLVIGSAYVIAMILTAISGILFLFYTESATPANYGTAYEMYGIAAAVVGGCSLQGGEGSILGIVLGMSLIQVLFNAVTLLHIHSTWELFVLGAVILLGVLFDQVLKSRRRITVAK